MNLLLDIPKTDVRREKILSWANRYTLHAYVANFAREEELLGIKKDIQCRGHLTKAELEKVVHWKSSRQLGSIRRNREADIALHTQRAFETKDVYLCVEHLRELFGVGMAVASAILHLYHKDNYPIYDVHALRAVGEAEDEAIWADYVDFCRAVAKENKVDMRTLDRALYRFGFVLTVL